MKKLLFLAASVVVATACSGDSSTTTLTSAPAGTESTAPLDTAAPSPPSSTSTVPPPPAIPLILARLGQVDLLTEGTEIRLEADADYPVVAAFDDLAGGLIYQFSTTPEQYPPSSILHMRAGGSTPEVVLFADPGRSIRLLDVETVDGRTIVLYLEGPEGEDSDSLRMADLAGGAPTVVAHVDNESDQGPAGVAPTAIVGGSLSERGVATVWWYGDIEAACSYVEVKDFDGALLHGPIPTLCGEGDVTHAVLSSDGSRLAFSGNGTVTVAEVESEEMLAEWMRDEIVGIDFDGSTLIITGTASYETLTLQGNGSAEYPLPPTVSSVVAARGPIDLADGTFLGGVRELTQSCSAAGMTSSAEPQGGLPELVSATRDGIVARAVGCDIGLLTDLAGDPFGFTFGAETDPGRYWRWSEQEGYGILGRIVDVLALPFVIQETESGLIYTWPSAFQANPSDEDWEALASVFNEEDIDLFRDFGGYIGMRVGIAEDGTWLFALEGD